MTANTNPYFSLTLPLPYYIIYENAHLKISRFRSVFLIMPAKAAAQPKKAAKEAAGGSGGKAKKKKWSKGKVRDKLNNMVRRKSFSDLNKQ